MSRGGAGRNQGRKAILTREQMLSVGRECQRRWIELSLQGAQATADAHEKTPGVRLIRDQQAKLQSAPLMDRQSKIWGDEVNAVGREIDEILEEDENLADERGAKASPLGYVPPIATILNSPRGVSFSKRPYAAKGAVLEEAIEFCLAVFGIKINKSRARECWYLFDKSGEIYQGDVNNARVAEPTTEDREREAAREKIRSELIAKINDYPHCTPEIARETAADFMAFGDQDAKKRAITSDEWLWRRSRLLAKHQV